MIDSLDPVFLSRVQFGLTAAFHYIYPPLSIGLGVLLVVMEAMYLRTGNPIYEAMTKFWVRVFALVFAMGVATGIVLEFQFGTNWSTYSRFVGDVFGSALAAEGIFAFFLESGFLAVLVFGWDKVSKGMHFFSTLMVALGSMFSAVWIVVANSWQQTPAGHRLVGRDLANPAVEVPVPMDYVHDPEMVNGLFIRAEIVDFWAMVFNPSSMIRLAHVLVGCYLTGAFVVMSICAWYILKGRHPDFARRGFVLALILATVSSLGQLWLGSVSAEIVAKYQPAKLAAMEGLYETQERAPVYLFGWPDNAAQETRWGVAIPGMLSFLVHWDANQPVTGLDAFDERDRPPVWITFQSYHIMVAVGLFFIALTLYACFLLWRGTLFETRWLMWVFVFSAPLPYVGNHLGWMVAEIGRQPWVVYNLLRTEHAASPSVAGWEVAVSLVLFVMIYSLLFVLFIYVLDRKIKEGPHLDHIPPRADAEPEDLLEAISRRGKSQFKMTGGEG